MTTAPYRRPDHQLPPRGQSVCPKCKLPCEVMEAETRAGTVEVSMCCRKELNGLR